MSETNPLVDVYHESLQCVRHATPEAGLLISAFECELAAVGDEDSDFEQESIDALARLIATLDASDNEAVRVALIQSCKRHDSLGVIHSLIETAVFLSMRMKKVLKNEEPFQHTAARYIDDLLVRFHALAAKQTS